MAVTKQWESAQCLLLDLSEALYSALSEEKQKLVCAKDKAAAQVHATRVKELKAAWRTLQEAVTSAQASDRLRIRPLADAVKHAQSLVWKCDVPPPKIPSTHNDTGSAWGKALTAVAAQTTFIKEGQTDAHKAKPDQAAQQQHSHNHNNHNQKQLPSNPKHNILNHLNHLNHQPSVRASLGPTPSPLPPAPPPSAPPLPPPLPPPPAPPAWPGAARPAGSAIANAVMAKGALKRVSTVVMGYQALVRGASSSLNGSKSSANAAKPAADKSSMLQELALKSKHRQQILMDVEQHRGELQVLAKEICSRKLTSVDELQQLVKITDARLDKLADECAVLKELGGIWPDKRYEAMRLMSTTHSELNAATQTATQTVTRLGAACNAVDMQALKDAQDSVIERVEATQGAWAGLKKLGDEHNLPTTWHQAHVKNLKEAALNLLHAQLRLASDTLARSSLSSGPTPSTMALLRTAVSSAYKVQNALGGLDTRCETAYAPIYQALQKGLP